ncbi:MAG: PhnA protein [Desulfotalea sp.]|nr:MAG: PhnA protein [Desulfotalea sp.]
MGVELLLIERSGNSCELCSSKDDLAVYVVGPEGDTRQESSVLLCAVCRGQIEDAQKTDEHHWRCLSDSMWSQIPAVQVLAYRMLTRLSTNAWSRDLLDMLYLEDDVLDWAKDGVEEVGVESVIHRDANGTQLSIGDSVTLIKDLNVKGGGFTAKRGTLVRSISLVADNSAQIEGKVSGQQIVLLTQFVKKAA